MAYPTKLACANFSFVILKKNVMSVSIQTRAACKHTLDFTRGVLFGLTGTKSESPEPETFPSGSVDFVCRVLDLSRRAVEFDDPRLFNKILKAFSTQGLALTKHLNHELYSYFINNAPKFARTQRAAFDRMGELNECLARGDWFAAGCVVGRSQPR